MKLLSRVQLLATPWTAAYQAPPSMGFSRQEYWSGTMISTVYTNRFRCRSGVICPGICIRGWFVESKNPAFFSDACGSLNLNYLCKTEVPRIFMLVIFSNTVLCHILNFFLSKVIISHTRSIVRTSHFHCRGHGWFFPWLGK